MKNLHKLTVDLREGPDEAGMFRVFGLGSIERWSLEQIKAHALAGNEVVLLVASTRVDAYGARRPNPMVAERRDRRRVRQP